MAELNWSDAQWQKVNDAVTDAFGKASVAAAFLPCFGPLPESVENVRDEEIVASADISGLAPTVGVPGPTVTLPNATVTVSDDTTLKLFNLRVFVQLSNEQVAD